VTDKKISELPSVTNAALDKANDVIPVVDTGGSSNKKITIDELFTDLYVTGDADINGLTVGRGAGDISSNTAAGRSTLSSNTTGNSNTASGYNALYNNTTGNNNTASGREALYSNTTGIRNTASGWNALFSNTTGSSNTALGTDAEAVSDTADNQIAIRAGVTKWYSSAGSPEGAVTAGVGSMYTDNTGGAGTTLYVKESGTGNTGWVAK
jgi:hypothetical protein